jgi:glycosyltransferase involved in cell wall biosynthesis
MSTIAVIVLAYNRPQLLAEALLSVVRQTRVPTEIIVVDDCSPQPLEVAPEIAEILPIRLVRQPINQGPAQAARRGLRETNAELVAFLNDDDLWEPTFLQRLGEALDAHPEAGAAFCDHWVIGADGTPDRASADRASARFKRDRLPAGLVRDLPRVALVDRSMPGASFSMTRRGELDRDIIASGGDIWDYFVCLCACRSGRPGVYVNERLGSYRLSPGGITANYWTDSQRRVGGGARRIVAARLILDCPALRSIQRKQHIALLVMSLRGVAISVRTRSLAGMRRGIAQIADALREPLP